LFASVHAETPEEWIKLGARVHGAFGSFIPVGIRIGLDALQRLNAEPRGVTVIYYSGPTAPCPCPADGIAIATMASPGQGTLQVAQDKALPGCWASP
jgi:formylmethanofuran dehydrogenase subunit E